MSQKHKPQTDPANKGSSIAVPALPLAEKRAFVPARLWWEATRPRMFPVWLSSGILPGAVALLNGVFDLATLLLETLLCFVLLSLSCWADEYGDLEKGVDNEQRLGPVRPMQRGDIPPAAMKRALVIGAAVTLVTGISLIGYSCLRVPTSPWVVLAFIAAGAACIWAAFAYTMGSRPYGYSGWGDFASFFFFGIVAGIGGYWLYAHTMDWAVLLPMSATGLLLAATINLQNIRDFDNDKACGKMTTAVLLGKRRAALYHYALVATALICYLLFPLLHDMTGLAHYAFVLGFLPLINHCICFWDMLRIEVSPRKLDTLMWPLCRGMGITAVLFSICICL